MKKTYFPRHSLLVSLSDLSWGGVAVGCAVVALLVRVAFPNVFWMVTAPLFAGTTTLSSSVHGLTESLSDAATLARENERLVQENTALQSELVTLRANSTHLDALGDAPAGSVYAGVIARPPQSPYDTLIVAGGTATGVRERMQAFGRGGVPLGVVTRVSRTFAQITLFSAPGTRTAAWVHDGTALTLIGTGGGTFAAAVARAAEVQVGDTVFVAGPGMLPIGRVTGIDSDPSSSSVALEIMPALNIYATTWVQLRDTGVGAVEALFTATSTTGS